MSREVAGQASPSLVSPHGQADYPGVEVLRPDPRWPFFVVRPEVGATLVARGGEQIYGTDGLDGATVLVAELNEGDRVTLVAREGPRASWRIMREAVRA
jgi:hypothetical protein